MYTRTLLRSLHPFAYEKISTKYHSKRDFFFLHFSIFQTIFFQNEKLHVLTPQIKMTPASDPERLHVVQSCFEEKGT